MPASSFHALIDVPPTTSRDSGSDHLSLIVDFARTSVRG